MEQNIVFFSDVSHCTLEFYGKKVLDTEIEISPVWY